MFLVPAGKVPYGFDCYRFLLMWSLCVMSLSSSSVQLRIKLFGVIKSKVFTSYPCKNYADDYLMFCYIKRIC